MRCHSSFPASCGTSTLYANLDMACMQWEQIRKRRIEARLLDDVFRFHVLLGAVVHILTTH